MNRSTLVESPLPVLVVLGPMIGLVGYLDWTVAHRTNRLEIIQVPRTAPADLDGAAEPDAEQPVEILDAASGAGTVAGPIHAEARMLDRKGHFAQALDALDRSLAIEGSHDASRLQDRGVLLLRLDRPGEALQSLLQARDLGSSSARLFYHLGLAYSRTGDRDGAEAAYRRTLQINPRFDEAWNNLALLLADRGDMGKALAALRQAVELAPTSGRHRPLTNLALLLSQEERLGEAEASYREALRLDPDYAIAWFNLAILLNGTDRVDEALSAVDAALAADPAYAKAWFLRGDLISGGRPEKALSAYERAYELDPAYSKAMLNAAVLHARAGRDPEAIDLYQRVLALDPRNASGWFNLGLALGRTGRVREAREAYEAALRADPDHSSSAKNLGVIYVREGRIEEAYRIFADALQRDPDDVELRYNLARQLDKLGRSTEAFKEMKRVIQLDPKRRSAWRDLRRIATAIGREEEVDLLSERLEPARSRRDRNR